MSKLETKLDALKHGLLRNFSYQLFCSLNFEANFELGQLINVLNEIGYAGLVFLGDFSPRNEI